MGSRGALPLAFAVTALLACGSAHAPQPHLVPATSQPGGARQAVLLADVNGDGIPDRVTLAWQHRSARAPFRGSLALSVVLSGGQRARTSVPVTSWTDPADRTSPAVPPAGVAALDGLHRQDVVVAVDDSAGSTVSYRVVGYHGNRLVTLPAPGGSPARPLDWRVGRSSASRHTFDCAGGRVIALDGTPAGKAGRQHVVRSTYQWRAGGWQFVSRTERIGPRLPDGWACAALRQLGA